MSGEQPADPYLRKRRNEEGYFEIYWALRQQKSWERTRTAFDPVKAPASWGGGHKEEAKDAWMSRAFFHVTHAESYTVGKHTVEKP